MNIHEYQAKELFADFSVPVQRGGLAETPEQARSVAEMLEAEGYKRTAVAVEVNLEIVPKTAYDTRVLQEDDAIEVVKFMGGG